jgi:glycosyltransferase 2 family protein
MKRLRVWIGIAISILCLGLALKDVRFADVWAALQGANYVFVLVTVLMTALGLCGRALRWKLLFYPANDLPLSKVFAVLNIGYLLMNVLPARLGDVARAILLGELTGVSKARTLSTIVVERVTDVLVVLLFLASVVLFVPVPDWVAQSAVLVGVGFVGLAAILVLLAHQRERGLALLHRLARLAPFLDREGVWHLVDSLLDGLGILRYGRPAGQLLVGSVLIWVLGVIQFHSVILAFDLQVPLAATVFIMCITALGMTVPSSPGYIGVWEYIIVLGLSLFGVDKSQALSYALVLHFSVYLTTTLMGALSLGRETLAMSILREEVLAGGKTEGKR